MNYLNESEFREAALAALTEALRRGLRRKAAYGAAHREMRGVETGGYCWAYPAVPVGFTSRSPTKVGDRDLAARYAPSCPCTACGGEWRGACEGDPDTWAALRRAARADRRLRLRAAR